MSQFSEIMGSFTRTGNYPLEANYIFPNEQALKNFYSDELNKTTIHKGLFKIVENDGTGKQSLYWVTKKKANNDLEFTKLISGNDINSIIEQLQNLETELLNEIQQGREAIKPILKLLAGTQSDDIPKYLETLPYKSITDLSDAINKFLNTKDNTSSNFNTLPELQSFLEGYNDKQKLHDVLYELKLDILGDPIPSNEFITLRDIENFIKIFKLKIEHDNKNFQQELDQTQAGVGLNGDGSFDQLSMKNTNYLDGSRSVIEALKALDREISGLSIDAFIKDAYYDSNRESIILIFETKADPNKVVEISVTNLIREWEVDNTHPTKVVELTREEVYAGGADKLSADVRISSNQYNILVKENNTLLVKGTSDNILHGECTVKEAFEKIHEELEQIETPSAQIFNSISELEKAQLKPGSTFLFTNDENDLLKGFYIVDTEGNYLLLSLDEWLKQNKVNKASGLKSEYNQEQYLNNPYYATDTKEILLNGENFGGGVQSITQKTQASNYNSSNADIYEVRSNTNIDELQLTFTPLSPLSLIVPETIGDISKGTTSASLKGKPISEILDSILFKTIYPTITDPSVTINGTTSTVEVGSALLTNLTHTFNKGTVVVNDGVTPSKNYVGDSTSVNYQVKVTGGTSNTNAGVSAYPNKSDSDISTVTRYEPGQYQYKVIINYAQGPLMTTSKGNSPNPMPTTNKDNITNPHPAGNVTSSYGITRNVTLPVFIDPASGIYNKQVLKNWGTMTFTGISMQNTSKTNPIKIQTPRKLQSVNSYNAVSGKYDVSQLSSFTMSTITKSVNGKDYIYYEYTWNGGALAAVNMEIKTY